MDISELLGALGGGFETYITKNTEGKDAGSLMRFHMRDMSKLNVLLSKFGIGKEGVLPDLTEREADLMAIAWLMSSIYRTMATVEDIEIDFLSFAASGLNVEAYFDTKHRIAGEVLDAKAMEEAMDTQNIYATIARMKAAVRADNKRYEELEQEEE